MTEDGFYIGIIKDRFSGSPVDRIVLSPLMEWDAQKNVWIDIDKTRCLRLFPDKGLVIYFSDDTDLLENQVLKFKPYRNLKYIHGDYKRHSKFSIDKKNFCLLWELLILEFQGSTSDLRDAILRGTVCNQRHNSNCLISIGRKQWIGPLKFRIDHSYDLIPVEPEKWHNLKIQQINDDVRIAPSYLDGRVFVDPEQDFGESLGFANWQPTPIFVKHLVNRLQEHLKKLQSKPNLKVDFHEL